MGSLHKGHLSLVERALGENEQVIVTIYVNPTQFNDINDYESLEAELLNICFDLKRTLCQCTRFR